MTGQNERVRLAGIDVQPRRSPRRSPSTSTSRRAEGSPFLGGTRKGSRRFAGAAVIRTGIRPGRERGREREREKGGGQACELNGKLMGFGLSAVYAAYIRHRPQLDSCCVLPRVYRLYLEAFHRCSTPLTALLRLHRGDATHGVFLAAYRTRVGDGPTAGVCVHTPAATPSRGKPSPLRLDRCLPMLTA